jgi:GH43 family beta-xylosidase
LIARRQRASSWTADCVRIGCYHINRISDAHERTYTKESNVIRFFRSGLRVLAASAAVVSLGVACATAAANRAESSSYFTNPLLPSGPDPWVVREGEHYYYMHTLGDRLAIWKTRDIAELASAQQKTIWTPPASGPNAVSIWAPELHRIDGKWYVYYTAAASGHDDDAHRGIFVLENPSDDPLSGQWTDRGRINTRHAGIDGTTFSYRGRRYFVYSPYVGPDSLLAIARMSSPTTLSGPEVVLARPDLTWERQGGRQILEGPEFLLGPTGDLFLVYSASACWSDDYALGMLRARAGSDPLDARVWSKSPTPVFSKAPHNGVFAPGHNGFFSSRDGREHWIIYHANSGPGMKCTPKRSPRIQPFRFGPDGAPDFGEPAASNRELRKPSG